MKYDNLFDYDFIREMRDNFQREEIHPLQGMLGDADNNNDIPDDDDDYEIPDVDEDELFYWEIDNIFVDENFLDEQYNYLYANVLFSIGAQMSLYLHIVQQQ